MEIDYIRISQNIRKAAMVAARTPKQPEKKLRELISPIWDECIKQMKINLVFQPRDERQLANGRADTVFNRLILEYKKPGTIRPKNVKNRQIIAQVKGYIEDLAKEERWRKERLLGVIIDGFRFLYIRNVGRWIEEEPIPINAESVKDFLFKLEKLTGKAALVPEYLIRDFAIGGESRNYIASNTIRAFYFTLIGNKNKRVDVFFKQWAQQFAEVHGTLENKRLDADKLFTSYGFNKKEQENFNYFAFFYALDTYYALLMKLLAYQVVGYYLLKNITGLPLTDWEKLDDIKLKEKIAQLEEGGIFRSDPLNIRNFLEGDLLSWYLNVWNESISLAIRKIIERLNQYDPETMEMIPDETRDIIKVLYQFLVPKEIRHDLGEYYTPDWLAERCLNQVGYGVRDRDLLTKRVLDPGCGSGTFLILAIKRAKEHARIYNINPTETLAQITKNIMGFDLNPLAVISARTNYLLAIADLLRYKKGEITIPIYLCDSINPPAAKLPKDLYDTGVGEYYVTTSVGQFAFPAVLIRKDFIRRTSELLEDSVKNKLSKETFLANLKTELNIKTEDPNFDEVLGNTYDKLLLLDEEGINGIWARIIKNGFAPLFVGQFDYVVGNPPWVNWESLPNEYRIKTYPIWQKYNLFEHTGLRARLGSAKDDISILMTYVSIDKYLKDKGKLCFVITQSLFKNVGGGEGFRRFQLGKKGKSFRILQVDDMVELQPFDSASNRTSVFVCEKNANTKYPVDYHIWKKNEQVSLENDLSLKEVQDKTIVRYMKAEPITDYIQGPWITGKPKAISSVKRIIGKSIYTAREGANNGGLAGVYWINVKEKEKSGRIKIENLFDSGKIKVIPIETYIESSIVFPLLRWSDMNKWTYSVKNAILIPHKLDDFAKPLLKTELPKLAREYFKQFEQQLLSRALFKKYLLPQGYPFYAIYNVGKYSLSKCKVCWQTMGQKLKSVVITVSDINKFLESPKPIVPQHTIVFIPVNDLKHAHYLCSFMNSSISAFIACSYSVGKSFANPHILDYIKIPQYDASNGTHNELASLSVKCHEKVAQGIDVTDIEEQIDELTAELWGLTKSELKDIKDSLEEL